jgi:hypothetical protein
VDQQLKELADNLGRREARVTIGDLELTLRPMTLNDMVASQQALSALGVDEASAAGLRSQLYHCAKRGGYSGTENDLAEQITELDIPRVRAALAQVFPSNVQGAWARLFGLYFEIKGDKELDGLFGPVAEAIAACADAVKAHQAGGAPGGADPAAGAGSSGG